MNRSTRPTLHAPRSTGFSFVELLFAVIILGIGFIMVAGIFPVAIRQSRLTGDETIAAADGRSASAVVQELVPTVVAGERAVNARATPPMPAMAVVGLPPTIGTFEATIDTGTYAGSLSSIPAKGTSGSSITVRGKVYSFRDPRLLSAANSNYPFADILWNSVEGNLINPTDPRSAYVLLYRRDVTYTNTDPAAAHPYTDGNVVATPAPAAQLIVIPVQVRSRTIFDTTPGVETRRGGAANAGNPPALDASPGGEPATLEPKGVTVTLTNDGGGTGIDTIRLSGGGATLDPTGRNVLAVAEGAFVVISDDNVTTAPTGTAPDLRGAANGHIYRLGGPRPDLGATTYELAPGYDLQPPASGPGTAEDLTDATAFLVGRGLKNPALAYNDPNNRYEGYPQDVAVFTTFIRAQ